MGKRKHPAVSVHPALHGQLEVNWKREYQDEFRCPHCETGKLTGFIYLRTTICKLVLKCKFCQKYTYLTCRVSVHIYSYDSALECPNPLCTKIGNDGQKGWIYRIGNNPNNCKCYFCGITFNPNSTDSSSWVASQTQKKLIPFCFDDDTWDLANFYK